MIVKTIKKNDNITLDITTSSAIKKMDKTTTTKKMMINHNFRILVLYGEISSELVSAMQDKEPKKINVPPFA